MPLLWAGQAFGPARVRARAVLAAVGLESRAAHVPSELSGGEAQRVAVARALAPEPSLLLADEPSGNLDAAAAGQLHSLLSSLAHDRHQTVVLVTHNDRLAGMADRVLRLQDGPPHPAQRPPCSARSVATHPSACSSRRSTTTRGRRSTCASAVPRRRACTRRPSSTNSRSPTCWRAWWTP